MNNKVARDQRFESVQIYDLQILFDNKKNFSIKVQTPFLFFLYTWDLLAHEAQQKTEKSNFLNPNRG